MRNYLMCAAVLAAAMAVTSRGEAQSPPPAKPNPNGWSIGADADTKKNPLTPDAATLATGKALFKQKCEKCHGPGGLGDGPDSDPDAREDMDLTNPKRAARNTDGVVYYKILNGRRRPKMPAFKEELKEEQLWALVTYAQSLRK